jgi:Mrp family chromosome partitioning ATPase
LGAAAAVAPKDKAVFVMVVKSPTAIVKERAGAPVAPGAATALQPGTAVEKAVAAATVVTFATPAAQLSELDRETIDNIAKLAARDRCELLIWARAKDPGLMAEAQRRASEIKTRVLAAAPLAERQVVTRITTRPGAQGVDVVVSALSETAKPAAAAAPAAKAGQLGEGEAAKRQVREAVQAAQPSIEACVGDLMEQKKLARAEGALKLTISAAGKVTKVLAGDGDLAGPGLAECLGAASGGWSFPPSDAEYVVDVPITVIRGGAAR